MFRTRTIELMAGIALSTSAGVAPAADSNDEQLDKGRALVNEFVTGIDRLSADFSQTLIDADDTIIEVSSGTLEIDRPGQFRWAYVEPYEQWLVADGLNIWSYDVDLAQVTVKPQAEALANTPALLLGGSAGALDGFEFGGSFDEAGLTWVRLTPINTEAGFRQVDMAFSDGKIARMVFVDNLEQTTLVSMEDVVVNGDIDPAQFRFVAPDDVDVVGTPATAPADNP